MRIIKKILKNETRRHIHRRPHIPSPIGYNFPRGGDNFGRMAEKPFFQTVYAVSLMVWDVVV